MSQPILPQTIPLSAVSILCTSQEYPYSEIITIEAPVLEQLLAWHLHENPKLRDETGQFDPGNIADQLNGLSEMLLSCADRSEHALPNDTEIYRALSWILLDYAHRIRACENPLKKAQVIIHGWNKEESYGPHNEAS